MKQGMETEDFHRDTFFSLLMIVFKILHIIKLQIIICNFCLILNTALIKYLHI